MSTETKKKKKFRLPHIFVLLTAIIVVCAVATWILPAGEFDRQVNEAGTEVVVPGTYHTVDSSPVGPFETVNGHLQWYVKRWRSYLLRIYRLRCNRFNYLNRSL